MLSEISEDICAVAPVRMPYSFRLELRRVDTLPDKDLDIAESDLDRMQHRLVSAAIIKVPTAETFRYRLNCKKHPSRTYKRYSGMLGQPYC